MRKVLVVSSSRADFGILSNLLKLIQKDKSLKLQFVITGSHLKKGKFSSLNEIIQNKIKISETLNIQTKNQNLNGTVKIYSNSLIKFKKIFNRLKPDLILILGDRFEIYAAALSAFFSRIPIAHIHGGEVTLGALDDSIRHSITKLAHLHLTSNKDSYRRVIKLGEEKSRVINIGYSAFIDLKKKELLNNNELIKKFKIQPKKNIILFTMHPLPLNLNQTKLEIDQITKALKKLDRKKFQIIATYPNFDPGYKIILNKLKNLSKNKVIQLFPSLGTKNYHSILNYIGSENKGICIGNSSSGIKEPVFFNCRSINIGNRQRNRIKPDNVIEINKIDANHIYRKILKVFKLNISKMKNPYALDSNLKDVSTKIIYFMKKKNFINKKCTY